MEKNEKFAILSDVNSNLEALKAVLTDAKKQKITKFIFLGDAIGHGYDPIACMKLLKKNCSVYLRGRIETLLLKSNGKNLSYHFLWHYNQLRFSNYFEWLKTLPTEYMSKDQSLFFVHTNPLEEVGKCLRFEYLNIEIDMATIFEKTNQILFIGDNHCPWFYEENGNVKGIIDKNDIDYTIKKNKKCIISVGSVGQPRNGDSRACYTIFSQGRITWKFVYYDILKASKKIESCKHLFKGDAIRLWKGV